MNTTQPDPHNTVQDDNPYAGHDIKALYAMLMLKQSAFKDFEKIYNSKKSDLADLKAAMLGKLNEIGTESYKGPEGSLSVRHSVVPLCNDWESLTQYIRDNNAFDLVQKRMSSTAWHDRIDEGEEIPGVESMKRRTLYITLAKK